MDKIKVANGYLNLTDDGLSQFIELTSSGQLWEEFSTFLNSKGANRKLEVKLDSIMEDKLNTVFDFIKNVESSGGVSQLSMPVSTQTVSDNQSLGKTSGSGDTVIKPKKAVKKTSSADKTKKGGLGALSKKMKAKTGDD